MSVTAGRSEGVPGPGCGPGTPQQLYRWNFTALLLDGGGFHFAVAFLSPFTLIPLFLSQLTDLAVLVGVAPSLYLMGIHLPQVFFANIINGLATRKGWIVTVAVIERFALAGMFGFAALAFDRPTTSLVGFLASYLVLTLCLGAIIPAHVDFVARTIVRRRGVFYGLNYLLGGVLGALGSWTASGILDEFGELRGLIWSFGIALGVTMVSLIATVSIKEPKTPLALRRKPWPEYRRHILDLVVERPDFRRFLFARSSLAIGEMAPPLYAVYAIALLGLPARHAGYWTLVLTATFAGANLLWGALGDRIGFRVVLVMAGLFQASAALLAVTVPTPLTFFIVFALVGGALAGNQIGNMNMTIDFAPGGEVPIFSGIVHGVQAPFVIAAPLLGGVIADVWSPQTTFTLTAIFATIGAFIMARAVRFQGVPTYKSFPTDGAAN